LTSSESPEEINEDLAKGNDILKLNSIEELIKIGLLFPNDIDSFNNKNEIYSPNDDELSILIRKTVSILLYIIFL
jgi:hypothetical protein